MAIEHASEPPMDGSAEVGDHELRDGSRDPPLASDPPHRRRPAISHPLVEAIRLIMVALFATAGWGDRREDGPGCRAAADPRHRPRLGGRLRPGRHDRAHHRIGRLGSGEGVPPDPAADILSGTIGLILGLAPAALLSIPLFHLPAGAAFPTVAFVSISWAA